MCEKTARCSHSLDTAVAGTGELEFCARIELWRRKGLPAVTVTGIRSGVLCEAPEQVSRDHHRKPRH